MVTTFLLAFIPVFVAVDALGVLPIYMGLTAGMNRKQRVKVLVQSMITAVCLALVFIVLGKYIFRFLGITMPDFMVAGGVILFSLAIIDIVVSDKKRRQPGSELGAVPLGTPLIVGPAVLTTSLILIGHYGLTVTLLAVIVNVLLAGLIFSLSGQILRLIGVAGAKTLSKVTALLLAAIAVMLIRKGIVQMIAQYAV